MAQDRNHTDTGSNESSENEGQPDSNQVAVKNSRPMSFVRLASYCAIATIFLVSVGFNISLTISNTGNLKESPVLLWPLLIGLVAISITSLILAVWLYYVRVVYLKNGPALVPEGWGEKLDRSTHSVEELRAHSSDLSQLLKHSTGLNKKSYEDLINNFSTLRDSLNAREKEIERLRSGYDNKIFKSFLRRFLRVDRAIKTSIPEDSDKENQKKYRYISRLMEDALDECGVEAIEPELGADFRDMGSEVSDDPKSKETSDPSMDFKISEIVSTGYKIVGQEVNEVIIPATVEIFRLKK